MEEKRCICCHREKSIELFTILKYKSEYTFERDNICDSCKRKNAHIDNTMIKVGSAAMNKGRYNKYNISENDYNTLFHLQEGKCKICGIHQSKLNRRLSVDHCHSKGNVRGLLCGLCNTALGLFKDNIKSMERAISYLKADKIN